MATKNPHIQLEVGFSATGVREGVNEVKQAVTGMTDTVVQQSDKAAKSLQSLGKAGEGAADGLDKSTRTLAAQIQRLTAAEKALATGGKDSAAYFRERAQQVGANTAALEPYIQKLEEARRANEAFSTSQKQAAAGQAFVQGLRDQVAQLGMSQSELLRYKAAQLGVTDEVKGYIDQMERAQRTQSTFAAGVAKVGAAFAALGVSVSAGAVLTKFITETRNAEQEQAQLAAVLKSTGEAAGWSIGRLNEMADSLAKTSTFSSGDINKAQARLLAYVDIVGTAVPETMQAVLNMSTRTGQALEQSAETLGKAINKPSEGMASLTRLGFKFGEEQVALAKRLEESGRLYEAQQIVLREMETSYGGAAAAARDTFGGALSALQNNINDLLTGSTGSMAELKESVEGLNRTLEADETKQAFQQMTGWIATMASTAVKGASDITLLIAKVQELRDQPTLLGKLTGAAVQAADTALNPLGTARDLAGRAYSALNPTPAPQSYQASVRAQDNAIAARPQASPAAKVDAAQSAEWIKKFGTTAQQAALEVNEWKKKFGDAFTPEMQAKVEALYASKDKGAKAAAASSKQEAAEYKRIVDGLKEKIAVDQLEIDSVGKLTDAQKERVKIERILSQLNLSAQDRADAQALLDKRDATAQEKVATEDLAKAKKALEDTRNRELKAAGDEVTAIQAKAQAIQDEMAQYGLGAGAITQMTIARLREKEAILSNFQDIGEANDANKAELDLLQQKIAAFQQLAGAQNAKFTFDLETKGIKEAGDYLEKYLDPTRVESFGAALSGAFEGAMKPLTGMVNALSEYNKEMEAHGKARQAAFGKYGEGAERQAALRKIESKELKTQVGFWGDLTNMASGYFKDGSKGYKGMQAASQAFRAAEMVLAMESMAKQLFGIGEVVNETVAGEQAKNAAAYEGLISRLAIDQAEGQSKATVAVATQGSGDPYSAFARMAAMAAAMAALGFAVGGGGGGGGGASGYTGIAKAGTGTVLGMEGEQSESLGNAIEILADNSKIELAYTQRMLAELTRVREGIQGLAGTASTDFFIRGFAGSAFGDNFLDSGIGFLPGQSVADIIEKGVQGFGFNLVFDKGAQAMWRNLDEQFTQGVGAVLKNVADVVFTAADALGLNDSALAERMLSLVPTLGDTSTYQQNGMFGMVGGGLVSLKDMSGEDIQKELEAIFSAVGDQMAAAALPALKPFQVVGEGMFETLIKVTTGIETAGYALEKFGLNAIDYTAIVRKQGDVAVEIMRQTIMGAEREMAMYRYGAAGTLVSGATPQTGLASIIEDFVGDASELEELYAALLDVRKAMKSVGIDALELSRDMIRGAGGIENLQSGLDSYFDNFFSEEEKLAAKTARLAEDFQRIGIAVPMGIAGFRAAVDQADEYLKGQLMGVAEAFYEVASAAGDAQRSFADVVNAISGRAGEFLTPGQMQAQAVQRIQSALSAGGMDFSFEQIMGYSRAQFASDIMAFYGAGNEAMVRLMESVADDFLSISQSTVDALQAQQSEASATVNALKADVDKWSAMRKSAQDLSRSIGLSITGGTGEADLWATVNGAGDLEERIKAATELKAIIERSGTVQMQAWQAALSSAQSMLNVGKQIRSFLDGLMVGNLSALTPSEQMAEAVRQYEDTLAKAGGGDKDAQSALQNVAQTYLQLAQQYDPGAYGKVFEIVTSQLEGFGNTLVNEAQAEVNRQQALISAAEAANGLNSEQISKLLALQAAVDKMTATADVKVTTTNAELAIANAKLASLESLLTAANSAWTYLPVQAGSLANIDTGLGTVVDTLKTLPVEFARAIGKIVGVDVSTIPGFASGGLHTGGARIVGERGPELAVTGREFIFNAAQTADLLSGGKGGSNVDVVAAIDRLGQRLESLERTVAQGDQMNATVTAKSGEEVGRRFEKGLERGARAARMKEYARAT